jgi:cell division protein FtsI (penicillin-binding protein 3)
VSKQQGAILKRMYIFSILVAGLLFAIFFKLLWISFAEGTALREKAHREVIQDFVVPAERGKIYSSDGRLLATSMPVFDVYTDPVAPTEADFEKYVGALASQLAKFQTGHGSSGWENHLRTSRRNGSRYVLVKKDVTFSELQEIRNFPLFNLGRFKGGLIYEQKNFRKNPLGKVAERTIGYERESGAQSGIEGAFSHYLTGKDGRRLKQKIAKGYWKPLNDFSEVEPENGMDVITTLDSRLQDVAHDQLLKTLRKFEADHGCVVLMEVKTGKIKAIANLGRNEQGSYVELRNYAVWEATEPGSTFKLAAMLVALEDGVIDTGDVVDTENGIYKLYDQEIRDSNVKSGKGGYGRISIAKAFHLSSNVGMVKAIYPHYSSQPEKFVDRLYKLGLHEPLGLRIKGEGTPRIPKPGDPNWSGLSLPWMCFGYEVTLTPLQLLTLYNAVANDGVMVKPQFVEEIRQRGTTVRKFGPEVMQSAIGSKATIQKLQGLLEGVISEGTGKGIRSEHLTMAGKTGTSRVNYWKSGVAEYQASFAGYFPAENPMYSCIVIIQQPNTDIGYYGSDVAAPIFKKMAEEAYAASPVYYKVENSYASRQTPRALEAAETMLASGRIPDFRGMSGKTALALLENHGVRAEIQGNGVVRQQSLPAGSTISRNSSLKLILG